MDDGIMFPYWADLERVIPVVQTQSVGTISLTLVSVELYARYGFLLAFNVAASSPSIVVDRAGRGWISATITDQRGGEYTGFKSRVSGVHSGTLFRGRSLMVCMPQVLGATASLSVTVEAIEWEPIDDKRQTFSLPTERVLGGWTFAVTY